MSGYPGFAVLLTRLLDHRELNVPDLTGTEDEKPGLQAVLGGAAPGLALLRWLAPALGMHVPDLYVITGMEVPQDLAPLDAKAGPEPARLAEHVGHLPEGALVELLELTGDVVQIRWFGVLGRGWRMQSARPGW